MSQKSDLVKLYLLILPEVLILLHLIFKVDQTADVEIPILEYPNWKVFVNGKEYPHDDKNHWGRLRIDLTPGNYLVTGKLYNTPVRTAANIITLISALILGLISYSKKLRKAVL